MCFAVSAFSSSARAASNPFANLQYQAQSGAFKGWHDVQTLKDLSLWYVALQTRQTIGYKTLQGLLIRHPDWPSTYTLRKLIEQKMPHDLRPYEIEEWFNKFSPVTGEGLALYLSAMKKMGHQKDIAPLLKKLWVNISLSSIETVQLATHYKHILTAADHRARAKNLFWKSRFRETAYLEKFLSPSDQKLSDARVKLMRMQRGVDHALQAVPKNLQNDAGLVYARIYWRRKKNLDTRAAELLVQKNTFGALPSASKWWRERHILARRAIEDKNYRTAYNLTSSHWQTGGFSFAQAEFLSGFLALRFLDQPRAAFTHFHKLHKNVKTPVSLSRAAYWTARAAEKLQQPDVARQWYLAAAKYPTTFYGQHAAEKLSDVDIRPILKQSPPAISRMDMDAYTQTENMRMLRFLNKAGLAEHARPFFQRALAAAKTPSDYMALVALGNETGQRHYNVFASKKILSKDKSIVYQDGYPLLPKNWQPARNRQDLTLIHAIIRQESNFEVTVKSPAGALGLMQLMPGTAGDTRRKLGIARPENGVAALITDPAYNVVLGSTYLQQMLDRFDGSAVMAVAAYNAGPARVDRWLKEIGDPRKHGDDVIIDWIELMPIYETRNYVQRVLENRFVYTHRLSENVSHLKLSNLF